MEQSIELVAQKCAKQLDTFQRCILANQNSPEKCDEYKNSLSQCASDAVPLVQMVKKKCSSQVKAYDQCLEKFTSKGDEALDFACTPLLGQLWKCTESVRRELQGIDENGERNKKELLRKAEEAIRRNSEIGKDR